MCRRTLDGLDAVAPKMLELAQCFRGVDEVATWGESAPSRAPEWDVQIEVTELPYFFRTRQRDLPVAANYLSLPEEALRRAATVLHPGKRMQAGVVWSSGEWNRARSIPLEELRPVFDDPGVTFWNLQGGEVRSQWDDLGNALNLRDAPALCADAGLVPLAAFIAHLDLVITVDTLAAHLAGALGRPTGLLLQHSADWRWMQARDDSPWYPSVRIFRQPQPGDWGNVIGQLRDALAEWRNPQPQRQAA
jgi:hypothetical protein